MRVCAVEQVEMWLIPPRADKLVIVVLSYVPDVFTLQIVLVASRYSSDSNGCNMDTCYSAKCQFLVIINSADAPNTANISQVGSIQNLSPFVTIQIVAADSNHHYVAVSHAHSDLGVIVERAHAVDTLRHLDRFLELEREFVVDENAAISTAYK